MRLTSFIRSTVTLVVGVVLTNAAASVGAGASGQGISVHFTSTKFEDTNLRYVMNSGICETTPGVTQYSGYITVGKNMSMWFWFFEARNSPETAPFTLWLNGGPGCSSMIGLFQENGPCYVNPDGNTTRLNPHSWNNVSNMIYIDQPMGVGFSYGTDAANTTWVAATFVWKAFQVLFESQAFSSYSSREFVFATESYGGHYGPAFVTYFDEQNAKIGSGAIEGELLIVNALLINNGWYDPLIQSEAYYTFAKDAPGYGQLVSNAALANVSQALWSKGGCVDQEKSCYAAGNSSSSDAVCSNAYQYCGQFVATPATGDRDPYDLRQNSSELFPPEYYANYLNRTDVMSKIGAEAEYQECADDPFTLMLNTGDQGRTLLPQLSALADSKLKILMWAGDTDIICNWVGGYAAALAMTWYGKDKLNGAPLSNMTLNGTPIASVVNVDNFSYARVYGAGHEVAAFRPAAALEIFSQIIRGEQLHSA
ncbi:hypothetical protein SCLCIDRAFT_1216729 [Scleroderma citrinum Foug A]|uniref:Carboxypeptidase n=1 Tax=Scleroderma citrinum Foug A TaxID=1036808 RepID=A0A0C2ZFI7_9AGAM|nr:hypothetical protein SCLCIDRAFT_1216729 [Scleroderma citrinum Foug A]